MSNNKLFQNIVIQFGEASERTVGVIDDNAAVIASNELSIIGDIRAGVMEQHAGREEPVCVDGYTYCFAGENHKIDYAVFAQGTDEEAGRIAKMASITLAGIKQFYDERYDKTNFVKNVVMDNILPGDIYSKAREMRFATDAQRAVLLVRINTPGNTLVYDIISGLFPDKQKDFIFSINETDIVIVKEVGQGIDLRDIEKLAGSIADILEAEHYINCVIGIGMVGPNINELASSFKEAQVALEVGKVFDNERSIIAYDNLGIARLIYQLPTTLCEMFLKEVFKKGSIDSLDQETLFTIQRFFENNLNVSETSRGLFVHRNTLVYRLEKIKKLTGLDLRKFDHAIIFKVALMVKKYLDSNPIKY